MATQCQYDIEAHLGHIITCMYIWKNDDVFSPKRNYNKFNAV